jgi:deoxyribodipyrimidine photo-lyase
MTYRVVWFKRDLRVNDHAALAHAANLGPVLCLYVVEPSLWRQPDVCTQHYEFLKECLKDLYFALQRAGAQLHVVTGEVTDVLEQLYAAAPFSELCSHEETGNAASFERDKAVARWCKTHGTPWQEFRQFGVVRALKNRKYWQTAWQQHMRTALIELPALSCVDLPWKPEKMPSASVLGIHPHNPAQRQRGGRARAQEVLHSFLTQRSSTYRGGISSPLSAPTACSRLSAYLTFGCLSMREVMQATSSHIDFLPSDANRQQKGLTSFISRLHWHCHFIQKLESEPDIEWRNMHRGYDDLREVHWNAAHFQALVEARTGWPLVDACVVMLRETGWLNFRMRAMLVSVATYPLWLHWRPVGLWLAQQFLDYEPGIHWSQLQMQSGTTGINTTRVYNPIKQAHDHDPHGHFVRRWLPAMRRVPDTWLFEPWLMPENLQIQFGVKVGVDIAVPLVNLEVATRTSKAKLHERRALPDVKAGKAAIVEKHASRRRVGQNKSTPGKRVQKGSSSAGAASSNPQLSLDL